MEKDDFTCPEKFLVDGYDTRFCHSIPSIEGSKNKDSLATLFAGFLDYYIHFDWNSNVVQIRRSENLTKTEKKWFDCPFCIEDPFKLHHNLTSAVSYNVAQFIMDTMCQTRQKLGQLKAKKELTFNDVQAFLESCRLPHNRVLSVTRVVKQRYMKPEKKKKKLGNNVGPKELSLVINHKV
ncbi:hypothetical protein L596_020813 [Steinernema carpocapsae]|uniref:PAP-associated domain-containing protein n=1 Tax=Steinernema carpocapsae TaxID=34508 RepID=A0A4U5MUE7_STECR|nr:hypothetical protein L596_020736 [Steinernema carpocapsae]TKR73512.1 hypothetical protein L596_020813 [Steinernema carpocapsae]